MDKEKLIERLKHCIECTEEQVKAWETEYKNVCYGNYAIDITMKITKAKGELAAYKEMLSYIKYN